MKATTNSDKKIKGGHMYNLKNFLFPVIVGVFALSSSALFADRGDHGGHRGGGNWGHHGGGNWGHHGGGDWGHDNWNSNGWGVGVGGFGVGVGTGYYGGYPYSSYGTYGYPSTYDNYYYGYPSSYDNYYYDTSPGYNSGVTFYYGR
jgi:hypothetical protein